MRYAALALAVFAASLFLYGTLRPVEHRINAALLRCAVDGPVETFKRDCLDSTVRQLMKTYTPRTILLAAEATSSPARIKSDCHVIAHVVGRLTYDRIGDLENSLLQCPGKCGGGCTHGVIGEAVLKELGASYAQDDLEHLDPDDIRIVGGKYCSKNSSFCHAIGHLFFLSMRSFDRSLQYCDLISKSFANEKCYRGVFMEGLAGEMSLFTGDEADKPLPERNDFAYPCDAVPEHAQHACFSYLPRYQNDMLNSRAENDPQRRLHMRLSTCETQKGHARLSCIEGIAYSTALLSTPARDAAAQADLCNTLAARDERRACILGQSSGYAFYERFEEGFGFCERRGDPAEQTLCYDAAFFYLQHALYLKDDALREACLHAPDGAACADHYASYIERRAMLPEYTRGLYGAATR